MGNERALKIMEARIEKLENSLEEFETAISTHIIVIETMTMHHNDWENLYELTKDYLFEICEDIKRVEARKKSDQNVKFLNELKTLSIGLQNTIDNSVSKFESEDRKIEIMTKEINMKKNVYIENERR